MITGALILLSGVAIGLLLRSLPARRKDPKPVEAVCGCKHHHAMHDPATGQCYSLMYVPGTSGQNSHYRPCTCRQYSGPLPLPEYYAPEIATEAGE